MDITNSCAVLAALSQQTRLEVFRLLVKAGAQGMLSGEISEFLNVRQNTMSANLTVLINAGILRKQRDGRTIRYYADFGTTRELLAYLMEDCCGGRPEICQPVIDEIACAD